MTNNRYLQGNLQSLFDALYSAGVIEPILKMDWSQMNGELGRDFERLSRAIQKVNACRGNATAIQHALGDLDQQSLNYLAMEVAREFAEFQDRKELH